MFRLIVRSLFVFLGTFIVKMALAGETTNKYGINMLDIPTGSFLMGSCTEEENKQAAFLGKATCLVNSDASEGEGPRRLVSVPAFQMGKTEVTLGQFKRFIADTGRTDLITDDFIERNSFGDNAPVTHVSWHDAQAFINWLNQTDGGGWRLPSEAEWEYACRAGSVVPGFCGGNNSHFVGWYYDNSGKRPRAVGGKHANRFGLHDMSGNVWEWVQDCSHRNYDGAPTDGSAWISDCVNDSRMMRGGSWNSYAISASSTNRGRKSSRDRSLDIGFRLARAHQVSYEK
ncbi:formylglycine-generating enzyme family protein [Vreelandella titanicae]|uniref:formylglycine-generating enzyme family protein n=1 Tax=Vreelandella titanicae TaxID=664683 RepID=UPI00241C9544|nr:formylglycine-generating enzyme family protein [Halomonas titanicae]